MRRLLIVVGAISFYIVSILFAHLPDRLILFPATGPVDSHGAARKILPFQRGELELWTARSRLARQNDGPEVYVLRFYGNADRADRWVAAEAEAWNERAVEVWGMNYPGFGRSTGPARLNRITPAALTALDALRSDARDRPIVVFGASIGSAPALHVAAHRSVAGLILHNPPALREMILRQFGWWNLWLLAGPLAAQIPRELDSVANAKAVHVPRFFCWPSETKSSRRGFSNWSSTHMPEKSASSIYAGRNIILRSKEPDYRICTMRWTGCCPGKTRVENLVAREFLNHFLHAAHHERKTVVVELVGSIGGRCDNAGSEKAPYP